MYILRLSPNTAWHQGAKKDISTHYKTDLKRDTAFMAYNTFRPGVGM